MAEPTVKNAGEFASADHQPAVGAASLPDHISPLADSSFQRDGRSGMATLGALGVLGIASFVSGIYFDNKAGAERAESARYTRWLGAPDVTERDPNPRVVEFVRSAEFQTAFIETTRSLLCSLPPLHRYAALMDTGELRLSIECVHDAQNRHWGNKGGESGPTPLAVCFDNGKIVIDERFIAREIERRIAVTEPRPPGERRFTDADREALAFKNLQTVMHEIGHELHDRRFEAGTGIKHYFITLEEELTVELESVLDFEQARRYIRNNPQQFSNELVRTSAMMRTTPEFWDRDAFEASFTSGYQGLFSISGSREDMASAWRDMLETAETSPDQLHEIAGMLRILDHAERFEEYRAHVLGELESVRQRWDHEKPRSFAGRINGRSAASPLGAKGSPRR